MAVNFVINNLFPTLLVFQFMIIKFFQIVNEH